MSQINFKKSGTRVEFSRNSITGATASITPNNISAVRYPKGYIANMTKEEMRAFFTKRNFSQSEINSMISTLGL